MKTQLVKNEPNRMELEADFAPKEKEFSPNTIEFIAMEANENKENSRILPIKLKPEEAKRAHEYQKTMLNFAYLQYKRSVGTKKKRQCRKCIKKLWVIMTSL